MTEKTDNVEKEADDHTNQPPNKEQGEKTHNVPTENRDYKAGSRENISHIINRRNRVLNHIRREQFLICFPSTRPFLNSQHAFECLLPYHFFSTHTTEDFLFLNTESTSKDFDVPEVVRWVEDSIASIESDFELNYNMVLDLMDLEAHKFILNKYTIRVEEINHRTSSFKRRTPLFLGRKKFDRRRNAIIKLKLEKEEFESHRYVRAVNEKLFFRREV